MIHSYRGIATLLVLFTSLLIVQGCASGLEEQNKALETEKLQLLANIRKLETQGKANLTKAKASLKKAQADLAGKNQLFDVLVNRAESAEAVTASARRQAQQKAATIKSLNTQIRALQAQGAKLRAEIIALTQKLGEKVDPGLLNPNSPTSPKP